MVLSLTMSVNVSIKCLIGHMLVKYDARYIKHLTVLLPCERLPMGLVTTLTYSYF